jgi:hypothetical protein
MTGLQLCEAALIADTAKVSTLLSRQGAQSFINCRASVGSQQWSGLYRACVRDNAAPCCAL